MEKKIVKLLSFSELKNSELEKLIEVPKDSKMGDFSFPCFSLSKKLKKNPAEIAKDFSSKIQLSKEFERVEAVGPYLNFFVNKKILAEKTIEKITKGKEKYGSGKFGKEKVMIEFSQANTHKAFHVGHVRGTSLGESLARILEFSGNNVVRANYQGDTGMHVAKWVWCYQKYHSKEELENDESWIANIYVDAVKRLGKNEKLQREVDEINKKLEDKSDKELIKLWKKTRKLSLDSFEKIYHELNTKFDEYFFENEVEKKGKKISEELVKKNIAKISDGATIVNLEKDKLGVWVLLRSDGTVLYSAKDLALAEKKFSDFKIDKSIYVVGSAQQLHFYQLFKTLEKMKFKQAKNCKYVPVSEVRFPWGKMSSRSGDNVLYSDFKKELVSYAMKEVEKRFENLESTEIYDRALAISIASLKYSMLKQDTNKTLIFDPKKSLSFEGDTGPYLLYSYARALSILKKAKYKKQMKLKIEEISDSEKKLIVELRKFPEIVKSASENLSPNLIANYSFQLAKTFSEFYHNCQVIGSEEERFRLKLTDCFSQTMKNSLYLLGIPVIPEM